MAETWNMHDLLEYYKDNINFETLVLTMPVVNLTTTLRNFTHIFQENDHRQGNQTGSINSPDGL